MAAFLFLFRKESAALDRSNAEKRECIVGNISGGQRGRLSSGSDIGAITTHQCHLLDGRTLLGPCVRVSRVDRYGTLSKEVRKKFAHREDTLRVLVNKRPKKHGVDEREDGRVRADTNCERKDSDRSEAGIPANSANGIPEVLSDGVEHRQAALITVDFFCRFDTAELKLRAPIRLFRRDAAAHVFFSQQLDMRMEFLSQIGIPGLS